MDGEQDSKKDLNAESGRVPDDFPRPDVSSVVAGFQAKLALVKYDGKLHIPGCTPPELFRRWERCEGLAQHLVVKSTECKAGKRSHMSESEILNQYFHRLLETGWGSDDEMRWVIHHAAALLLWSLPASAVVDTDSQK